MELSAVLDRRLRNWERFAPSFASRVVIRSTNPAFSDRLLIGCICKQSPPPIPPPAFIILSLSLSLLKARASHRILFGPRAALRAACRYQYFRLSILSAVKYREIPPPPAPADIATLNIADTYHRYRNPIPLQLPWRGGGERKRKAESVIRNPRVLAVRSRDYS
jgi:hypothetical protein